MVNFDLDVIYPPLEIATSFNDDVAVITLRFKHHEEPYMRAFISRIAHETDPREINLTFGVDGHICGKEVVLEELETALTAFIEKVKEAVNDADDGPYFLFGPVGE